MKKSDQQDKKATFSPLLLKWNKERNNRKMPWKGEKDPYKIWLSEIILQQTRVDQGLEYYEKFIRSFPNIKKLAKASDTKVFKLWEGLGYYTRCRNLLATARMIVSESKGKFPDTYDEILNLKGVGPYTAAAISSFAFNLPYAVIDGNVFRVLSRVFGIETPIDSTVGKKYFNLLAEDLLDQKKPGIYNQAIMDFGAVVCKPVAPICMDCVFKKNCVAFSENKVALLPIKGKKISVKKRWFYYIVMEYKNEVVIEQRKGKDIWQDLYEFPLIETKKELTPKKIIDLLEQKQWLESNAYELQAISPLYKQKLTHQLINGKFISIKLNRKPKKRPKWQLIPREKINQFAFPNFINQYLQKTKKDRKSFIL